MCSADPNSQNDAFICHASEDKEEVARPLADELTKLGVKVWYDDFSPRIGDSLSEAIDAGLASSKYGIVILSPAFFKKNWPHRELGGIIAKEADGHKVLLPVWHNVDAEYLNTNHPLWADRLGAQTSKGIEEVARELCFAMKDHGPLPSPKPKGRYRRILAGAIVVATIYIAFFLPAVGDFIREFNYSWVLQLMLVGLGLSLSAASLFPKRAEFWFSAVLAIFIGLVPIWITPARGYNLLVTIHSEEDRAEDVPLQDSKPIVKSVPAEPKQTKDGKWEIQIPAERKSPTGKVSIEATAVTFLPKDVDVELKGNSVIPVSIGLKPDRSATVSGWVKDGSRRIQGASVSTPGNRKPEITDTRGHFELPVLTPEGSTVQIDINYNGKDYPSHYCSAGTKGKYFDLE